MDEKRRRLLYRATHRGFKEADIVIGGFARENIEKMAEVDLELFEKLLEVPDWDLYGWIVNNNEAPPEYTGNLLDEMRKFGVAKYVRDVPNG